MQMVGKGCEKVKTILEGTTNRRNATNLASLLNEINKVQEPDVIELQEIIGKYAIAQGLGEAILNKKSEGLTEADGLVPWLVGVCCALSPLDSEAFTDETNDEESRRILLESQITGLFI